MIPHICTVKHDPPNSYGDCMRACVASMLDIEDALDVPHFMDGLGDSDDDNDIGMHRFKDYLLFMGYRPFYQAFPGSTSLDKIFELMSKINNDILYLLLCDSGGGDHVVLCCNGQVIHNPAIFRSPIDGPTSGGVWVVVVLTKVMP